MKQIRLKLTLPLLLLLMACSSKTQDTTTVTQVTESETAKVSNIENVRPLMLTFRKDLDALAPYLYSKTGFQNPQASDFIKSHLSSMNDNVKKILIYKRSHLFTRDPSLQYAGEELKANVELSYKSFLEGQKDFSTTALKDAVQQCFYCHTRNDGGPRPEMSAKEERTAKWIQEIDKVDYYVALREFNLAREALLNFFRTPHSQKISPLELEALAKKLLALEIRVKRDPKSLEETLSTLSKEKNFSKAMKDQIKSWKLSSQKWKAEKPTSGLDKFKEASLLVTHPKDSSQINPKSNDVDLLRATTLLHDHLEQKPPVEEKAKSLLLLGMSYEKLRDLGFWNLDELYYEDCVRTLPHSNTSKLCFQKWDDSIVMGYSGSAGTSIPDSVEKKRTYLRDLAN